MTIIQWIGENVASSIAIFISIASFVATIILNHKEKPNIMPQGEGINGGYLSLVFLNTSQFNIHNLTILINGFDNQLNEISAVHFFDKFLFSIGEKTIFNYGFNNAGQYTSSDFYFRVRFCGKYKSRFPVFPNRNFEQSIWYSAIPMQGITKIFTTHKENIEKLEAKHAIALKNYEQNIDKRFSS